MTTEERQALLASLRGNAEQGKLICMDRQTTALTEAPADVPDVEVVDAISSVPCHY